MDVRMWIGGAVGAACGLLLTADAVPRSATILGGLLCGAIGTVATWSVRRRGAPRPGVRWPVVAGVLGGGVAGGLIAAAVVAPRCAVDGGTLTALCVLAAGLGGGQLVAEGGRRQG